MLSINENSVVRNYLVYHNKNAIKFNLDALNEYHRDIVCKKSDYINVKFDKTEYIKDIEFLTIQSSFVVSYIRDNKSSNKSSNKLYDIYNVYGLPNGIKCNIVSTDQNIEYIIFNKTDNDPFILTSDILTTINMMINFIYAKSYDFIPCSYTKQSSIFIEMMHLIDEIGFKNIKYYDFEYDITRDKYNKAKSNKLPIILDMQKIVSGSYNVFINYVERNVYFIQEMTVFMLLM